MNAAQQALAALVTVLREDVKAIRTVPIGRLDEEDTFASYLLGALDTTEAVIRLIDALLDSTEARE